MRPWARLLFAGFLFACLGGAALWLAASRPAAATAERAAARSEPEIADQSGRVLLTPAQAQHALATGAVDRPVRSLLDVGKRMRHGDFVWRDTAVPSGPVWVRVDLDSQIISVFRSGHEIGTAVILYGADSNATPVGRYPVQWKRKDHHSATYDAPMPYTLRLTDDGVAIHGSDVRWGRATHGCIGVPLEFARRLFDQVRPGDEVVIVGRSAAASA
jgi:lipoprotein-anchoring transpeptidase ErfK/SrfK